jgi:hypothetical protein
MALSKKTISKHNLKRAEVFAEHGLGDHDVAFAHPNFEGLMAGGDQDCCLCGHRHIAWQFSIKFDEPDVATALGKVSTGLVRTEEVTLKYVGSKCITDWLDAVPESKEKLEALKRWDAEMKKCLKAKKLHAAETYCEQAGFCATETHTARQVAYRVFNSLTKKARSGLTWKEWKSLTRNAWKVRQGTCAATTSKNWLALLQKALEADPSCRQKALDDLAKLDAKAASSDSSVEIVTPVKEVAMTVTETTIELSLLNSDKYKHLTGAEIYTLISTFGVIAPKPSLSTITLVETTSEPESAPESEPESKPESEDEDEDEQTADEKLLAQADALVASGAHEHLSGKARETFDDMHGRLKKYGSFKTDKQAGYFKTIMSWAKPKAKNGSEPASKPAKPVTSASGIEGARY